MSGRTFLPMEFYLCRKTSNQANAARGGVPAWPGGPAAGRGRSEDRFGYYHRFAVRLAEEDSLLMLPRIRISGGSLSPDTAQGTPSQIGAILVHLGQHERTLEWLAGLPYVDPARIGFYGLSYGGKTAVRVPPLLENYALSICSADSMSGSGKTPILTPLTVIYSRASTT